MGEKDLYRIYPIYHYLKELEKNGKLNTNFKQDSGKRETGLMISEHGGLKTIQDYYDLTSHDYHYLYSIGWREFVPDILSLEPRTIIIEFQEESKPKRGYLRAKNVKRGHAEFNKRDVDKKIYYEIINALYLEIWESQDWKKELEKFLQKHNLLIKK